MVNDVNYQTLANEQANPFIGKSSHPNHEAHVVDETTDTENEDAHRDNSIMIHVVPDTSKGLYCFYPSTVSLRTFRIIIMRLM